MYTIQIPADAEYERLINIWEASVIATHHFLTDDDIQFFKRL
jgi:putative acetyltransferase